jgi:mannosyltransferase OCH1-like enzyme
MWPIPIPNVHIILSFDFCHGSYAQAPRSAMIISILAGLGAIPKILHVTWKDRLDLTHPSNLLIQNGVAQFARMNPDWTVELSTDEELNNYLKLHLLPSDYHLVASKHMAEKSDLWRLLKMCNTGGIYMDIDRLSNTQVTDYIKNTTKLIIPQFYGFDSPGTLINFSQDFFGSAPGNKVFCEAAKENVHRRRSDKSLTTYNLGPHLYTEMVSSILFGAKFIENPPNDVKKFVRRQLILYRDIVSTYREIPPLHTISYRSSNSSSAWHAVARNKLRGKGYRPWY